MDPHDAMETVDAMESRPLRWVDHHCHLPADLDAARSLVEGARAAGVVALVDVGCDLAGSEAAIERARRLDGVHATAGVHPHEASGGIEGIEALARSGEVVAIGECGLDFHYLHSPAPAQREVFAAQVELAVAVGLPLVIHTRDAWRETFDVLAACPSPVAMVFHCFTGGPDEAKLALDVGGYLSFSGIISFPSADDVRAAATLCPHDRVLVETDSPYLAPVPHRGRPNRPELVPVVGAAVAEVTGMSLAEVAACTSTNAAAVYGVALHGAES